MIKDTCWRKRGCPFNSNNSFNYKRCWKEGYSVDQCRKEHSQEWDKIDNAHTDSANRQHLVDGSVIEFIVDTTKLSNMVRKMGDC